MGLLKGLVTLPLAPLRGTIWIAEQVSEQAWRELHDQSRIRRELEEVERLHDRGELSDEEYETQEEELLRQLAAAAEARRSEA